MITKKTYIPAKPRNKKLINSGGGSYSAAASNNNTTGGGLTFEQLEIINNLSSWWKVDEQGNLYSDKNVYSKLNISAYGFDSSGGGGGESYNRLDTWASYDGTKAGWVLSALLGKELDTRVINLENGSAMSFPTTGTGNAITSISKAGSVVTANKDLTFSLLGHIHPISDITNLQTTLNNKLETSIFNTHNTDNIRHITGAERTKWNGVVTDLEGLEIGGRNLLLNSVLNITSNSYGIDESHRLLSENYIEGETYTITLFGTLGADRAYFAIFNHASTIHFGNLAFVKKGIYRLTFIANSTFAGTNQFRILQYPNNGTSYSIIDRVNIQKGNKPTDWTPAPEDQVSDWLTTDVNSFSFIKNKPTLLSQFTDNIGVAAHIANTSNPHNVTKAQIGLGNIDNTSDLLKPISTAMQNALNTKLNLSGGILSGQLGFAVNSVMTWHQRIRSDNFGFEIVESGIAERFIIAKGGNVGIGTITPQYKLDVSGTGRFTGDVSLPSLAMTGALSGATTIAASTSVTAPKVIFAAAGWSMEQVGSELQLKHNGILKQRFLNDGTIVAMGNITAFN